MYRLNIKDGRVIAEELTVPLKAGDCLIFPSCIMHTVKPVTKGKRHSVVSWFGGERIGWRNRIYRSTKVSKICVA